MHEEAHDEDNTKSISVQELQKALMYHIVGFVVVVSPGLREMMAMIIRFYEHFLHSVSWKRSFSLGA